MKSILFNIFLFFVFVLSHSISFAVESLQKGPYKLEEIVVTASRITSSLIETPANISIITKEDIEESGATNIIEALRTEPGVFTANLLNNPKMGQVDIRGFGEAAPSNVLFLIDGRRINGIDLTGADLSQIPVSMIERIEIYRGPVTVLFGDNAIGGAINIILKKGEGKPKTQGSIMTGSYNLFSPRISVSGKVNRCSYFVLGSYFTTDGYRHNNHLRTKDLFGNFSLDVTKNITLNLQTGFHNDSYGLPGALSANELNSGRYDRKDSKKPDDFSTTEDNFVNMGIDIQPAEDTVFSVNGFYRIRHSSARYASSDWNTMKALKTYGLTPKITIKKPVGNFKNTFVAGFDYYIYPTRGTDFSQSWFTDSITKIKKTDYAVYIHDEFSPSRNLILSAGYRVQKSFWDIDYVDNFGFIAPIDTVINDKKEAFRFSLNYLFEKNGNIFVTYSKGFRMPATDELFNVWALPPVNRALKTQVTEELDLGARFNLTSWIGGSLTLFQSKTENEIYYNPYTFSNSNYDKTKREGIEATVFLTPVKDLNVTLQYSYTNAKFDRGEFNGYKIPFVPQDKFSLRTTYLWQKITSGVTLTYFGRRYLISDQKNELPQLPGITLIDLDFKYTLSSFEAIFGIKNVTGKRYSEYGVASYPFGQPPRANYYPSPERQFYLTLSYNY